MNKKTKNEKVVGAKKTDPSLLAAVLSCPYASFHKKCMVLTWIEQKTRPKVKA